MVVYRYPPELWTAPLTGAELIPIDSGSVYPTQITVAALLQFLALGGGPVFPTVDPHVIGGLWNNGGYLCVSTG